MNRKADFLQKESIRIDSHNESNRIDSNRELECSSGCRTSAHLICARLAAYKYHRCTTFSCSEVWILCWFLSGVYVQRQACRGWLYEPPLFRYGPMRQNWTLWRNRWFHGLACQAAAAAEPNFTAFLADRAKVDDVIRGIPVVVGYRSTRYSEPGVHYQERRDARTTTVKTVPLGHCK